MFLRFAITLVAVLVITVVVTQVIIPIWKDKPVFPIFRKKTRREQLEDELEKLEEFDEELRLQRQVSERLARVSEIPPLESTNGIQSKRKESQ